MKKELFDYPSSLCPNIFTVNFPEKTLMIGKEGDELRMLTIEKVPKNQAGVLQNLYSLYLHDLSAYTPSLDIREDGAFHFEELPLFWKSRRPLAILY